MARRSTRRTETLDKSPPRNSFAEFLARQAEDSKIKSVLALEGNWKYIDFKDPFTGLPSIAQEYMLGARGFKTGTVNQLRALWSKGKSSYCYLQYAAGFQDQEAICFHLETEGAGMPPDRVASFGIPPDAIATANVYSFEDCVSTVDDFICRIRGGFGGTKGDTGRMSKTKYTDPFDAEMKYPIMIGIDSVSQLGKEAEQIEDIMDISKSSSIAEMAKSVRKWLRGRAGRFKETQCCVFLTSHETQKIETGFNARFAAAQGPQKTSMAGDAFGMADSVGIDFASAKWRDARTKAELGSEIKLHVFKNKLGWDGRRISLFLEKDGGWDLVHSDVDFLVDNPMSPFKATSGIFDSEEDSIRRTPQGIRCPLLSDKCYRDEAEFISDFYANKDLVDHIRDGMRIRGYGLPHETKYKDLFDSEGHTVKAAADKSNPYAHDLPVEPAEKYVYDEEGGVDEDASRKATEESFNDTPPEESDE